MSGFWMVSEVTLSCLEKINGISCTPTFTEAAFRNGSLLKAGSSAIVISLALAPPLRRDASSLPICTGRLSAAESFFSKSGRKLSTLMNNGTAMMTSRSTPTTIPEITSKRFMGRCYQKATLIDVIDTRGGLPEHTFMRITRLLGLPALVVLVAFAVAQD